MKCFVIAVLYDNNKIAGYRLFDAESQVGQKRIMDVSAEQLKKVLGTNASQNFVNVALNNGEIVGTNGIIDRYTKIDKSGYTLGNCPLVVINRIGEVGYTLVDYKGEVAKVDNAKAVEYSKGMGIANGKVVNQDNIEYISSIANTYDVINVAKTKFSNYDKSVINYSISISGDESAISRNIENSINSELEYTDALSALTSSQKRVLKNYYTWYTVDVYKGLAKSIRLEMTVGKAEKLAALRGTKLWNFGGVWDTGFRGGSHCEFGHALRYEFYAIPENDEVNNSNAKMVKQSDSKIIFGETCASDFFHISPDDMEKLIKTRKIMSAELEYLYNGIANDMEEDLIGNYSLLNECLCKLTNEQVYDIFGTKIGGTIVGFQETNIPFPKSLVIMTVKELRKNYVKFFKTVFMFDVPSENLDKLDSYVFSKYSRAKASMLYFIDFITKYTFEGCFKYDPLCDEEKTRRDIGGYNKQTRDERTNQHRIIRDCTMIRELDMSYSDIKRYITLFIFESTMAKKISERLQNGKFTSAFNNEEILFSTLHRALVSPETNRKDYVDTENIGCVTAALTARNFCNSAEKWKGEVYSRNTIFYSIKKSEYSTQIFSCKDINAFYNTINDLIVKYHDIDSIINKAFEKFMKYINEDLSKERYFSIVLYEQAMKKIDKCNIGLPLVFSTKYSGMADVNTILRNGIRNKREVATYGGNIVNFDDIDCMVEIKEDTFTSFKLVYDNKIDKSIEREQQSIKEGNIENAKINELESKQNIETERHSNIELSNSAKIQRLKELIDKYPNKDECGIPTTLAILESTDDYDKMSTKQKWRIDDTLKRLDCKYIDKDVIIKELKDLNIADFSDTRIILAIKIAKTIAKTNKISDSQDRYLRQGYTIYKNEK